MRKTLKMWMQRKVAELYNDRWHECEGCGDIDGDGVHAALSTGEVVCWHCAERAGEYQIPPELEWRSELTV